MKYFDPFEARSSGRFPEGKPVLQEFLYPDATIPLPFDLGGEMFTPAPQSLLNGISDSPIESHEQETSFAPQSWQTSGVVDEQYTNTREDISLARGSLQVDSQGHEYKPVSDEPVRPSGGAHEIYPAGGSSESSEDEELFMPSGGGLPGQANIPGYTGEDNSGYYGSPVYEGEDSSKIPLAYLALGAAALFFLLKK